MATTAQFTSQPLVEGTTTATTASSTIAAALATRIANMPKGEGYKKPGSMNPRKTGFMSIKANEAKRILSK